jgi:ADP-ribose pyrophosphatase YjhB (NUDIX family)
VPKARQALVRRGYRIAHGLLRVAWFLTRPRSRGVKCVVRCGDEVVLVRHTYGRRHWELPGGFVRPWEEPVRAAHRELSEELGRRDLALTELGTIELEIDYKRDTLFCYSVLVDDKFLEVDSPEIAEANWFSPDTLPASVGKSVRRILALERDAGD